jgi:hypothetical protein
MADLGGPLAIRLTRGMRSCLQFDLHVTVYPKASDLAGHGSVRRMVGPFFRVVARRPAQAADEALLGSA